MADGLADRRFRTRVTGGGVDQIDAPVEQGVENVGDLALVRFEEPDGRAAKPEDGDLQAGFAERARFHFVSAPHDEGSMVLAVTGFYDSDNGR